MTDQQKKANKFLRKKFKGDGHKELRMLVVKNFADKVDLIEEYTKMISWCTTKHKKASMLRFNNWVKKSIQFRAERSGGRTATLADWEESERKTKERLKELNENKLV